MTGRGSALLVAAVLAVLPCVALGTARAGAEVADAATVVSFGAVTNASWTYGPTEPCSDAIAVVSHDGAVEVHRTGATGAALVVSYDVAGTAQPGVAYTALPGEVTIPAASSAASIVIHPAVNSAGSVVLTLPGSSGYAVGGSGIATVMISGEDVNQVCSGPTLTNPDAWSRQTIHVGERPASLPVVPVPGGQATSYVESGAMPPGLGFGSDGVFTGTATQAGSYELVLGACTPAFLPPRTDGLPQHGAGCVTTPLHLVVLGAGTPGVRLGIGRSVVKAAVKTQPASPTLPNTGGPFSVLIEVGVGLAIAGALALVISRRQTA